MDINGIRNTVKTSHPPIHGTSSMISNDASSMYPSVIQSLNSGIGDVKTTKYYIVDEFPYKILHHTEFLNNKEIYNQFLRSRLEKATALKLFDRRLDAEKYRLEKLIIHAPTTEKCEFYKEKLASIETDHPEWLI